MKQTAIGILLLCGLLALPAMADESLNKELFSAILAGDKAKVESLLGQGADLNARNDRGETPLLDAALQEKTEIAELLIAKGADVNAKDSRGDMPIHDAAFSASKEITELLIAKGADVNAKGNGGDTPLMSAASWRGDKNLAEFLISKGAQVDARNNYGVTALAIAAAHGHVEYAGILIAHGADVNNKDNGGGTPLHEAAGVYFRNKDMVDFLLDKGAAINARDNAGDTPLHKAVQNTFKEKENAQALISHGADTNAVNKAGLTPMQATKDPGMIALFVSGHAKLGMMIQDLQQHPNDEALRKSLIETASRLKPAPAIPAEAADAGGRAKYRFGNAKSTDDTLAAAKEYMKAIDAAPWAADYYYNLGVILEKTEFASQALAAYRWYLTASPDISESDEQDVKARIAGLQAKAEDLKGQAGGRIGLYFTDFGEFPLYEAGGVEDKANVPSGDISITRTVSLKLAVNWKTAPPRYELLMYCGYYDTQQSKLLGWTDTQELVNTDRVTNLCQVNMHLVIKSAGEGFVELADMVNTDHRVRATLDELFKKRSEFLKRSPIYLNNGRFYVKFPQGGADDNYAGFSMHESDCNGNSLRDDPRVLPGDFLTMADFKLKNMGDYKLTTNACTGYFKDKTGYSWLGS